MILATAAVVAVQAAPAAAHVFVFDWQRIGAPPCRPGNGWSVEVYWGMQGDDARHILAAEAYAALHEPTFSFRADYLDWPAGPVGHDLDTAFPTMGDFLNDYISDISDPEALELPFDNFLLRARGYINVRIGDGTLPDPPPVWMDFGTIGYDGYRVRLELTSIYRIVIPTPPDAFYTENAIIDLPGVYPIEVTYFQKYDPTGEFEAERAGLELMTCHTDGMETPNGHLLPCPGGPARLTPPWYIYDEKDVRPVKPGDFDVDGDVDLRDWAYVQNCFTGPDFEGFLTNGCHAFDADRDDDVDLTDVFELMTAWGGPGCTP